MIPNIGAQPANSREKRLKTCVVNGRIQRILVGAGGVLIGQSWSFAGLSTPMAGAAPPYARAMTRDPSIPDAFDAYTLVLLRRPADPPDMPPAELEALQAKHLEYRAELR